MASQNPLSGSYTWKVENYSRLTHKKHYSNVFTVGSYKWRVLIYPKGNANSSGYLGVYLDVPDAASLPVGWSRETYFTLTVINQNDGSFSMKKDHVHAFGAREAEWGYDSFMGLSYLHNLRRGFLVNDTLYVKAEVDVLSVVPPPVIPQAVRSVPSHVARPVDAPGVMETNRLPNTPQAARSPPDVVPAALTAPSTTEANRFDCFFSKLDELIVTAETSSNQEVPVPSKNNNQIIDLISGSPGLVEVEEAKQSLKECLSDLFKLNMKDRLASALLTLSRAEVGLSSDQRQSIKAFRDNFDEFISDFFHFEQDNSEFELQKLARDKMFSAIKKNRDTHLSNKQLMDSLNKEEEDIKKRMEEVKLRKEKLMSDWDSLRAGSEEAMSKYSAQENQLAEAEEKKRIAEESMLRSAAAWSSLKAQFIGNSA